MDVLSYKLSCFEGPLDLLLHLISKAKVDITEVFVSEVTEQYLKIVGQAQDIDMDSASEFLQMAATLLLIKSRALLPSEKEQEALEEDKRDIMERLAEYRPFKEAGEHLSELQKSELGVVYKLPEDIPPFEDYKPMFANATVQALSKAYIRALRRLEKRKPDSPPTVQIVSDSFSLRRQTQLILTALSHGDTTFDALLSASPTREEISVTFLALLELLHMGTIELAQNDIFGEITISMNINAKAGRGA